MTTAHDKNEAEVHQRIDDLLTAVRAMDLTGVMALYAPEMVSFDMGPPLRAVGAAAKQHNWVELFALYQSPLGYEIHDLTLTVGDDVAFAYSLNHSSGTLRDGRRSDLWLRWTSCWRKRDGEWRIVHDHVSVPIDFVHGSALLSLQP